jgi:hypothetical protein
MYLQQFLGMLDEENPWYFDLVKHFQDPDPDVEIFVFAESEGINTIPLPTERWSPLFDKRFGIIFVVPYGFHKNIIAVLWRYHNKLDRCDKGFRREICASQYLQDDLGWYIGSIKSIRTQKFCVETSNTYVFDEFDKAYLKRIGPYCIRTGLKK